MHKGLAFPGIAELLPTLGTAAVIAGGSLASRSVAAQLLSFRPMVAIGLLSYSWYLWHWPLLAITRAHELGRADLWRDSMVAIVALGLAWLTYVCVEHPIRSRQVWKGWSNVRMIRTGAAASIVLIAGALALRVHASQLEKAGVSDRFVQARDSGWSRARCHHSGDAFDKLISKSACMHTPAQRDASEITTGALPEDPASAQGEKAATVAQKKFVISWGDSHADHFAAMLQKSLEVHSLGLLSRSMGGCPPVTDVVLLSKTKPIETCTRFNAEVMAEIDRAFHRGELAAVVLSARWSNYLRREKLLVRLNQPASVDAAPAVLAHGLKVAIRTLTEKGIRVVVNATVPEHRFNVPNCLRRRTVEFCSIGRDEAESQRSSALRAVMAAIRDMSRVQLWDPLPALCREERCLVERDGVILYLDNDHLNSNGSRWLAPYFAERAAWFAGARHEDSIQLSR
jgi:hypothetical protein